MTATGDWDVAWPEAVAVIQRIKRVRAAQLALVCATHTGHICESASVCVCVYLLNTCEILYPYLVFACVEACFAIVSALPPPPCPRILLWHLHLLSPRCAAKTYAPCVCVCVSATVHLFCVYLSILYLARERFLCHCANYTKTTTSGSTDNVCHHMHHSARSNPPPPSSPSLSFPSPPFYCIRYTHNICASISVRKL